MAIEAAANVEDPQLFLATFIWSFLLVILVVLCLTLYPVLKRKTCNIAILKHSM